MKQKDNEVVYSTGQNSYADREKRQGAPHHRRCIDGKITGCGNCVGYCTFQEHPGYLTKQLRKEHDCIKKNCHYYQPKEKEKEELGIMVISLSGYILKLN